MRRLCGLTLPPSTLDRGVALWTESLAASPASLGAPRESGKARTTTAGSGPSSLESFARSNRHCASSKTCLDLFQAVDLSTSFLTLPPAGSMRNGVILKQPPLALRTNETGSGYWPSSRAEDSESCGNHPDATDSLTGAVRNWPTLTIGHESNSNSKRGSDTLYGTVENWKTPHGMAGMDHTGKAGGGGEFAAMVERWQTPKAGEEDSGSGMNSRGEAKLKAQAQLWTTPKALTGGANSKREERGAGGPDLQEQTATWASPMARDWRGGGQATVRQDGKSRMDMLDWQAEAYSRRDQQTDDGPPSSPDTPGSRPRLNPAFTAWLMGLPWWWTNPGATSSVRSEMEAYRSALRSRLQDLLRGPSDD